MSHLKKVEKANIFATLKDFSAGETEFIPFEESRTETRTWDTRCRTLRKQGLIEGRFKFINSTTPAGTIIYRAE